jgi:hypothetical protein
MRPTAGRSGVRQRKLNPKAGQTILRQDQIEDYDALVHAQPLLSKTGVEVCIT